MISEPRRGYGNAYLAGLSAARGTYIVMLDADLTYDAAELPKFIDELEDGGDMVLGDRMKGIQPGAMPWLHQHVGNPVLTGLLNRLFGTDVRDAHCGMRAVRRDVLPRLDLRTSGMELASEMVIRAAKAGLDIRQFPIEYHRREGESKLSTWSDGWRHLRFLLIHSPRHLFLIPGMVMAALGSLIMAHRAHPDHPSSGASGASTRRSADRCCWCWASRCWRSGSARAPTASTSWASGTIGSGGCGSASSSSTGCWLGGAIAVAGLISGGVMLGIWIDRGFGSLAEGQLAVLAATLVTVGAEVFFTSFLLSILGLRRPQ